MGTDWGSIFELYVTEGKPWCEHDHEPTAHDRIRGDFAQDEYGDDLYAHVYFHWTTMSTSYKNNFTYSLPSVCCKPFKEFYNAWLRDCDLCGTRYSNPWVPVCADCWDDPQTYPSWQYVIAREHAAHTHPEWFDLPGFDRKGERSRPFPTEKDRSDREYFGR